MKKIRVIMYQKSLGITISHKDTDEMKSFKPHFICFPEYFFVNKNLGNQAQTPHNQKRQMGRMELLSKNLKTVVIGGTTLEISGDKIYNTSYIFDEGKLIGSYRKKNLFLTENEIITPGDSFKVFSAYNIKFGVLICADVFDDKSFEFMKKNNAKIIFSPTFSPRKEETVKEKFKRDKDIYVRGASIANSVIVKVCGVKSDYRDYMQARSLIADKNDIIYRVNPDEEDKEMIIKKEIFI